MKIMKSGKSQVLRHLSRTHHVSIAWLAEQVQSGELTVEYVVTALQAADVFTKAFTNSEKWSQALRMIGLVSRVQEFEQIPTT